MRRRDFFKRFTIGAATVVVAPAILAQIPEEVSYPVTIKRKGLVTNLDISPELLELSDTDWQFIESREIDLQMIAKHYNYPICYLND
jgi:hypothetical protein